VAQSFKVFTDALAHIHSNRRASPTPFDLQTMSLIAPCSLAAR
jgi:hypothetical protein